MSYSEESDRLMVGAKPRRTVIHDLREENARLKVEIERLRDGGCRFNCRTQKDSFIAGFWQGADIQEAACGCVPDAAAEVAYREWRRNERSG